MSDIWLSVGPGVQVGLRLEEALSLDHKGFSKLYRSTVYGSSRKEANEWATEQILKRAELYKEVRRSHDVL